MDRNLIMLITLCKLNYVKLKNFVERMGAFTGRTHRFRLHAQHAGLAHDLRRARNPFASQQIRKIGYQSGGLFSRKKPYQEVP